MFSGVKSWVLLGLYIWGKGQDSGTWTVRVRTLLARPLLLRCSKVQVEKPRQRDGKCLTCAQWFLQHQESVQHLLFSSDVLAVINHCFFRAGYNFIQYSLLFSCWVMFESCVTRWSVALQAPLSMGCPWQEYWSGLSFPSQGDLPNPGIEPASPALTGTFFTPETPGSGTYSQKNPWDENTQKEVPGLFW